MKKHNVFFAMLGLIVALIVIVLCLLAVNDLLWDARGTFAIGFLIIGGLDTALFLWNRSVEYEILAAKVAKKGKDTVLAPAHAEESVFSDDEDYRAVPTTKAEVA